MTSPRKVVLLVEDDAIIRMGAFEFLSLAGFEAIEASNADEAIRVLEARPDIHLVLTDVEMPGSIDGVKLSHYIRDRWPPVKLIVVSGRTIVAETHLPTGARFYAKPYDEISIVEAIHALLADARQ
jgi:DNA-binding NtrC family response regulator